MNAEVFYILRLFSDRNFHSDSFLLNQLNFQRESISTAVDYVETFGSGLVKYSLHEYGYRWTNPILWLDHDKILNHIVGDSNCFDLKLFDVLGSTNTYLLDNVVSYPANNQCIPVVATELQTKGRGRSGRIWQSGLGDSLTFSIRWCFAHNIASLSGLSLVIAVAIMRVLKSFSIDGLGVKWPNDIIHNGHKLAGILIEVRGEVLKAPQVVIGIGINFSLPEQIKSQIKQPVIDLLSITNAACDRNAIFGALLSELRVILSIFTHSGFSYFKREWISYHVYEERQVCLVLADGTTIEGMVDGVDDTGAIGIVTTRGKNYYHVGDISLRPIKNE